MKIISGVYSGRPLYSPDGMDVRPTLAKTRESVFNITRSINDGSVWVDCFAGTGAMGFVALSNGAQKVYFIENKYGDCIRKNADRLKVDRQQYGIIEADFRAAIGELAKKKIRADIVFADPPYNLGLIKIFLKILRNSDILNENALVIVELHRDEMKEAEFAAGGWTIVKEKKYGETYLIFLKI
jgi:16S rRNA (guanine966-N2)-methyltransferase